MTAKIFSLTLFIIVQSLLVLFAIAFCFSFIPIHWSGEIPKGLEPERESILYIIYLISLVAVMVASVRWVWPVIEQGTDQAKQWRQCLMIDGVLVGIFIVLFAKWVIYSKAFYPILMANDQGVWVKPFMAVTLIIAVIMKIFWFVQFPRFKVSIHWPAQVWLLISALVAAVLIFPTPIVLEPLSFYIDGFQHLDQWPLTRFFLLNDLSYTQTMLLIVLMAWIMTVLVGVLVYKWLANVCLAIAAMALFLKIGFFNYAQTPVAWINPSTTPLAGCIDILAYGAWFVYVRTAKRSYLSIAIAISVVAIWFNVIAHPWVQAPIYQSLRVRQFWSFFMTFILAGLFLGTACFSWISYYRSKQREWIMPGVIALGGFLGFWAYMNAPAPGAYAWCALSLTLLIVWSIQQLSLVSKITVSLNRVSGIVIVLSIVGLLTNYIFLAAPHLNIGMYQKLVDEYKQVNWQQSATVINQYSPNQQVVALISPYEIAISQAAGRQLFFNDRILHKIDQIQNDGPCVLFVDRNWVTNPEASKQQPGLVRILENISRQYKPLAQQPEGILTVWINNRESCLNR